MVKPVVLASAATAVLASEITVESFGAPQHTWSSQNDPVMGGKSTSTFTIADGMGTLDGTCAIVPSLNAPGFITARTSDNNKFPDISSCEGLAITSKSVSTPANYEGYRISFGSDSAFLQCGKFFARGFKADFTAGEGEFKTVQIPFNMFTKCWDDATGDAVKTCEQDSRFCPTKSRLADLQTVSIWAEGKEADVTLDIQKITAYGCPSLSEGEPNIVELAQSVDDLSTLVAAVVAGDLVETLSSPGPFTVFAPTNEGFAALPEGTLDTLLKPENKDQLVDILTYHVLPAQVLSTDLKFFQRVNTVEGKPVHVYKTYKGVYVSPDGKDFKTVVGADNKASNGVAHIIDGVLIPPAGLAGAEPNIVELAQSVDDLSTLVAAVVAGDLVETLSSPGPFTVFAPTNEGFAALPEGTLDTLLKPENKDQLVDILTYHVLPAQVLSTDLKFFQRVNTVEGKPVHVYKTYKGVYVSPDGKDFKTVVGADNKASNGVAHIIDGVLIPPAGLAGAEPNIVELAQSVDDLSTLVAAVVAGDLVETLSSPGPFTVFAPTNEAFGALPEGTLDTLLKPENKDQLVDILTYHVLPAQVLSTDLKYFQRVQTVEGKNLHVYKTWRGVFVSPDGKDFKTVVGADNKASNGVAHIIDGVLLPPSGSVVV